MYYFNIRHIKLNKCDELSMILLHITIFTLKLMQSFDQRSNQVSKLIHSTLQEHQKIRTNASAGNDSDLLRVPLPAAMFVVTWTNQNFSKVFSDI